ncbi:MAG TPA: hypothetical protein VEJ84_21650 [Acidimicrobiales bacterium]|nr:hypothetical protein [Acidimicrobiales bacterium]
MSEDGLRRLLEKLDTDESFRQQVTDDPRAAIAVMDISGTERYALVANDQDALRRLLGAETSGYSYTACAESANRTELFSPLTTQADISVGCATSQVTVCSECMTGGCVIFG